ncbi:helix-turn-helix transcriptional regulator (plasmid) [Sphingobium sp. V4]|uniref:helix-turn-helix domain-containing protein n=1 Tax=Sphingobium sp. V4 TaxID=3038927 RepID=UPI0025582E1D|nr:helix-turn-helix transcriptional regulator [Sphingobium sp. V4]WIW90883.1 helix-turn-helix transcriptional regulator [Sphingobium sp. V4]
MTQKFGQSRSRTTRPAPVLRPLAGVDAFRAFLFPNNIREYRKKRNAGSLLQLSQSIPSITYIRLSKIERGEIFARADEIRQIATALEVDPERLLIDIDDAAFDIAAWAAEFQSPDSADPLADSLAVLVAAAVRARRAADASLTIAAFEMDYGIAPVILSRIENAYKPFDRWSADIQQALCRLFGVRDAAGLEQDVVLAHARGELDAMLPMIANPETRIAKTRARILALRRELAAEGRRTRPLPRPKAAHPALGSLMPDDVSAPVLDAIHASDNVTVRLVPVFGAPLNDGLIARIATGEQVEAPRNAGPRAYGLRICRPTLGSGLPGRSTIIVDPDRFPSAGGLAVIREAEGLRLLSVTFDRQGRMFGYSEHPDREIAIDDVAPEDVATVLSAQFE